VGLRLLGSAQDARSYSWFVAALSSVVIGLWQPLALVVTWLLMAVAFLALRHGREDAFPRIPAPFAITVLVATLLAFKYIPGVLPVVPLGLSFTVFRLIGVILDVNALRIAVPPSRLAAMALFFPTFLAGPITTVQSFRRVAPETSGQIAWREGGWRVVQGLARKALLADPLYGLVISPWLARGVQNLEPYQCVVLPVFFGFYVYWDFAGYSDMAIGMARLLGYSVPENFDRPYFSRSVIEFWRRWHITLSEWIRARLMMKMTGRRPSTARLHAATLVSMALCGLWHGAGAGFVVWGVWHGVGLVALHLLADAKKRHPTLRSIVDRLVGDAVATAVTFGFVTIGWTFFFLTPADALTVLGTALAWRGGTGAALLLPPLVLAALWIGYLLSEPARRWSESLPLFLQLSGRTVLVGLVTYSLFLTSTGRQGFIYTQF
jgi:alginate O-acetyltransferase complex protein AlgI